jgi:flavorubredoxin
MILKRRSTVVLIIVLVVLAVAGVLSYLWLNQEVVSEVEVRNPEGDAGTALVVYHPGKSDFQERVTSGFVEGLVSNDWRVEITTASAQALTDLAGYDLLVLGGPTYWFTPARPIRRYLSRLGDLGGQRTVAIITAMGAGGRSISIMDKQVREANGDLIKSLILYTFRPNEDLYGINDAVEIATQAAKEIPLRSE